MAEYNNDHRTYRDLMENRFVPFMKRSGLTASLADFLSRGVHLPLVGFMFRKSFTLICLAINRLRRRGDIIGLYELLIQVLLSSSFRKSPVFRWWYLMRFGIAVAQEQQINWLIRDPALEDDLMMMGALGPKPWKGYDIAYSFVGYSLWLFERGDVQGAVNMVQIAAQADMTWGYPEYLYGWYGLFTKGVNSIEHFTRAVQVDWSFLQRIKQDRTCQQYPDLLKEVQKRILVSK